MITWLRHKWKRVSTRVCDMCGEAVRVKAYIRTGATRGGSWWEGSAEQLQCPQCGATFWTKK